MASRMNEVEVKVVNMENNEVILSWHDKIEIEKLKVFKEWVKKYRKLSKEEKEKLAFERWQG